MLRRGLLAIGVAALLYLGSRTLTPAPRTAATPPAAQRLAESISRAAGIVVGCGVLLFVLSGTFFRAD